MYVSPSSTSQYFNSIIDHLEYLFSNFGSVLVLGDFNCPDIDWPTLSYSSEFSSLLCDFVFKYNLTQEVAVPTHNKGGTLDLAITNSTHLVNRIKVYNDQFLYSDHFLVNLSQILLLRSWLVLATTITRVTLTVCVTFSQSMTFLAVIYLWT